ncbi:MAG: trypsin-like peptidase domain-containing protein [Burkholderiales bacterium]|nr:trypsin-like peptidase domain-containing protein [Burkholderiales bacterium]
MAGLAAAALAWTPGLAIADLPDLVATVRPSVLPVGTFDALANPRFAFRGSGFVIEDGTVLVTNAHVLPPDDAVPPPRLAVLVTRADGSREARRASLFELDRVHDLALLRLEGPALPALALAPPGAVREGMDVAFVGYPIGGVLGYSPVTHRGIVSSITAIALPSLNASQLDPRAIRRLRAGPFEVYQLDATAYPGNSGGPLLDVHTGRVIGIINMVLVRSTRESALTHPTGITYAIPARYIRELLSEK